MIDNSVLDKKNIAACKAVKAMTAEALTRQIYQMPDLLQRLNVYRQAVKEEQTVFIIKPDGSREAFSPMTDDAHAMLLMRAYQVVRDYEPYECLGEHYRTAYGQNPICFFENEAEIETDPAISQYSMHACICRAVVLNHAPEMVAHFDPHAA